MRVLLPFYCYFMLETAVNCKYRFLAFLHKCKYGCIFSELVFLFLCTQSTSCMTAPNPLCALVWKQSTQYSPKHQRSATLGMCRKIYSTVVIFNMFMIPSKVNILYICTNGKKFTFLNALMMHMVLILYYN